MQRTIKEYGTAIQRQIVVTILKRPVRTAISIYKFNSIGVANKGDQDYGYGKSLLFPFSLVAFGGEYIYCMPKVLHQGYGCSRTVNLPLFQRSRRSSKCNP